MWLWLVLLYYCIPLEIVLKYTAFGHQLMTFVFILALYNFIENESYKNAIILGIV